MGNIEKKTSMENNEIPKGIDGKKVEKYLNKEDLSNVKKALKNVDSPKALKVVKKIDKKLKNVDGNNSKKLEDSLKKGKDYPDYINMYGVGKKVGGNTYDGVGIKLHNDNFEGKFEHGKNYNLASAIGKIDITDNTYSKIGASYLKYANDKNDYRVSAGIKYTFGGGKKGGWSPYVETSYNTGEHTKVGVSYEENIADRPVQWKDEFENQIGSNKIKAAEIAPDKFKNKVIGSKEWEELNNLLNEGNDKDKKNKDNSKKNKDNLSELDNLLNEGNDKDKKKTNNSKDNKDDIVNILDQILEDDNDNNNQENNDNSKNDDNDIGNTLDHILGDNN